MTLELDHTIVFARDREASAALLAALLDVPWSTHGAGPFCPVFVNDGLTLDVDQVDGAFPIQHFCFRVDDAAFDGLLGRLAARGIAWRSTPFGPVDHCVNTQHGGRIAYWSEPDGHVWEALTTSHARRPVGPDRRSPLMQIPTLLTERLVLRPLGADCESMYDAFYTDAQASAFYNGPLTSAAAFARLAADLGTWHLRGFGVWAVQRRDAGELVGVCGFWQGKGWPRELTWWLLPRARGAGLAQEASRAAIDHAYRVFGWPAVETYTKDENAAARALVRRLGGVAFDRRVFPDGVERDLFRFPPPTALRAEGAS